MNVTDEERQRLLGLFDEQTRSLRRTASFFLLPALVFGALIFVPFTQQTTSSTRLTEGLDSARVRLAATVESLRAITAVDSLAEALRVGSRLRRELEMRRELWNYLTEREEPGPRTAQAWATGEENIDLRAMPEVVAGFPEEHGASDCIWLDDGRWRSCYEIAPGAQICQGRGCVVYPDMRTYIAGGPGGVLDQALVTELIDTLTTLETAIRDEMPTLAELAGGPDLALSEGYIRVRESFEGLRNNIHDRELAARAAVEQLARDTARLNSERDAAERLIQAIETSGGTIETPIGPLPVGIRELVFLYPTILGLAYLLCISGFRRLVSLRRAYHALTERIEGGLPDDRRRFLTLSTPLWYEPLRPGLSQIGRVGLGLVPLAFMAWCFVALRFGLVEAVSASDARFGQRWYELFLLLTFVAVGIGLVRLVVTLRNYAREAAAWGAGPTEET